MGRAMLKALRDAFQRRDIKNRVKRHGWTIIYVGDYHAAPTWAYTVGFLTTLGAPEVIVFDLPRESAAGICHEVFRQLKSGELLLEDGVGWPRDEPTCTWKRVDPSRYVDDEQPWLGIAETLDTLSVASEDHDSGVSSGREFEAFQLVLSDPKGRFPWHPEYDERLRPRQRELYLPLAKSSDLEC
jgi:hypothetical protein